MVEAPGNLTTLPSYVLKRDPEEDFANLANAFKFERNNVEVCTDHQRWEPEARKVEEEARDGP
jgi:hypothetical protein